MVIDVCIVIRPESISILVDGLYNELGQLVFESRSVEAYELEIPFTYLPGNYLLKLNTSTESKTYRLLRL